MPECYKAALKRLVGGGAGLIFKGSGFYITDYKNKGPAKAEGGESAPAAAAKARGRGQPAAAAGASGRRRPVRSPASE